MYFYIGEPVPARNGQYLVGGPAIQNAMKLINDLAQQNEVLD